MERKPHTLTAKQKRYIPIKRALDVTVCLPACILLSPLMLGLAAAIKADSPGPVLFKQKRVGKDKEIFEIWKFRTMRTDAPKDMPTHMLDNPDAYITRIGRFMRLHSLDELPQLYQTLLGVTSLVGPRPALWNQEDLIAERDKYGANSVKPGITGWAQINGRDELEISVKAKFDGEYVEKMGFRMDAKCFLATIGSVLRHDGVVEGGTGTTHKGDEAIAPEALPEKIKKEVLIGGGVMAGSLLVGGMGLRKAIRHFTALPSQAVSKQERSKWSRIAGGALLGGVMYTALINAKRRVMLQNPLISDEEEKEIGREEGLFETEADLELNRKKILITGADSYVGMAVERWLKEANERRGKTLYQVDTLDVKGERWKEQDFSCYDVVFHVAGIAHADVGTITQEQKQTYYKVNTDLAVEVAAIAKKSGVKQFIFMSSMIVYSGCKEKMITKDTIPTPLNVYGDSKWQADHKIQKLADSRFKVVVLRPPMIYGKGSKGNYPELSKLARKLPVFPIVKNKRSMLHIDNLCQFVKLMIDNEESGIFFPQNREYTNTSDMVQKIAKVQGHRIIMIPFTHTPVRLMGKLPGKIGGLAEKAFGDSAYDMDMSCYKENYQIHSLLESIQITEEG